MSLVFFANEKKYSDSDCTAAAYASSAARTCQQIRGRSAGELSCEIRAQCRISSSDGQVLDNNITIPYQSVFLLSNCNGRLRVGGC